MTNGRDPAEITHLAIERRLSRRNFLVGSGAGLGALALAACAPPSTGSSAPTSAASAPRSRRQHAGERPSERRPGRHPHARDLAELPQPGGPGRVHRRDRRRDQRRGLWLDRGDGGQAPRRQLRHRCRRPVELRHRGLGEGQPHRADRLREAARFREGRLEPAVHGPGVRQGQRRLHPQELGHDRDRLSRGPGARWRDHVEAVLRGRRYDVRGQGAHRRPPDQLVRLGGRRHGLLAQYHRRHGDGRGGGDAHRRSSPSCSRSRPTCSRRCGPRTRGCRSRGPATASR